MSQAESEFAGVEGGVPDPLNNAADMGDIPVSERRDGQMGANYKRSIYALPVTVQMVVGTARPTIAELLRLKAGSVLEMDKSISDPVDVCIDNRVIARGELIETDVATGEIGLKITEIVDISEDMLSA
jgi:flagellar motor switch protein FliN/FliY